MIYVFVFNKCNCIFDLRVMKEIIAWLNDKNRDHFTGVALLNRVSRNRYLIRQLSLKKNLYTSQKLFSELRKIAQSVAGSTTKIIPEIKSPTSQTSIKTTDRMTSAIDLNNMTDEQTTQAVEKLETALGKMYNKRGLLSNSLRQFDANDNASRQKVLQQIDGLNDDMNAIREKLNYHKKHGKLPPIIEDHPKTIYDDIPVDPVAMKEMLLNERTNVSRYKKKLKAGDIGDVYRAKTEKRLQDSSAIINEIERRLKHA